MKVIHESHPWKSSMRVIHECYPWKSSKKVVHESHPWKSMTVSHDSKSATVSHFWLVFHLLSSICFNWPLPAILLSSSFNIILLVTCSSVWISNYILRSQVTLITGFGHFMLVLVTLWGPTLLLLEHTNLIPAYFQLSNGRLDYRRNTHKPLIFFHY